MDVVAEAGIDVSDWSNYARGAKSPAANPAYCYSWTFAEPGRFVLLNLWYVELKEADGTIFQDMNYRELATQFERSKEKSAWGRRAREVDLALQLAWREKLPVKVVICDGQRRDIADPYSEASKVERRVLDNQLWAVTDYDWSTGAATVTRGASPEPYLDQFSVLPLSNETPVRTPRLVEVPGRSADVRRQALRRAKGCCQWCKEPGFCMPNGRVFLETHHVVPLSEGGIDTLANVVALCANHHREAHYGEKKSAMRERLLSYLDDA
ncbi:HNH endonuclease signature motif containing protein [Limnobacter sp.]|uniref:HNH endonuclease n=1 Tax=Limnobacter sp. TaxID=2003368 RepID=UPI00258C4ABE|nr:HNH endonuclease signature motif containing protein [Limnobacter sp.]